MLFALGLRLGVVWSQFGLLSEDRDHYLGIARQIVSGCGYCSPATGLPTADRPPAYPLLLAAILALQGGPAAMGLLQVLLGVLTVWLTMRLAQQFGSRTGWFAGLILAADPLLLHSTALIMTETLAATLLAAWLWSLTGLLGAELFSVRPPLSAANLVGLTEAMLPAEYNQSDHSPSRGASPGSTCSGSIRLLWAIGCGMLAGLAVLCRPVFLPILLLFQLAGLLLWRRGTHPVWTCAAVWLGVGMILLPWTIRNAAVMGRPIVTSSHGGYTLLLAHNPVYDREVVFHPERRAWPGASLLAWQDELEHQIRTAEPAVNPDDELARDDWMAAQAWQHLRSDPGRTLREAASLLLRFWSPSPIPAEGEARSRSAIWIVSAWYAVVFCLAIAGLVRLIRGRLWGPLAVLVLPLVGASLVHSLYWSDMRMRAPFGCCLALLVSITLQPRLSSAAQTDHSASPDESH